MRRALVYGLGITGRATVRALRIRDVEVVVIDDGMDDAARAELGAEGATVVAPDELDRHVGDVDVVIPAPGVPETHPVIAAAAAAGRPVRGEMEIAYELEQRHQGGPRPLLAITGTDGKTTTTLLTAEILHHAGRRPIAAGNTETPLIEAIDSDADTFVVEATSFRLAFTEQFRAEGAIWLNLAPDHLNWHASMDTYEAAKARIFTQQHPDDVAIGFAPDPVVARHLAAAPGRRRSFALTDADYRIDDGRLIGPHGPICATSAMARRLPHDQTNALAAAALTLETGLADARAVEAALGTFTGPPHRLQLVADRDGVRWYNDSKATTPHAASVALAAFERVVLIAGGSDKGLDLAAMAAEAHRLRYVVAIGDDPRPVERAFGDRVAVVRAASMSDAVRLAAERAEPEDVVLLSPGFASFDWYSGYDARGDDFTTCVLDHLGRDGSGPSRATDQGASA